MRLVATPRPGETSRIVQRKAELRIIDITPCVREHCPDTEDSRGGKEGKARKRTGLGDTVIGSGAVAHLPETAVGEQRIALDMGSEIPGQHFRK